jgi:hypothetical protein
MTAELQTKAPVEDYVGPRSAWFPKDSGLGRAGVVLSPSVCLFSFVLMLRVFALAKLTDSQFLLPSGGDMRFYNDWALRILRGQWTEHTAFYGLPLYAYLLAGIYKVCGYSPFVPGLLQAACDAGTAVLLYNLGNCIFAEAGANGVARYRGKIVGTVAAIGWAFFLPAQAYSIILMPTVWLVLVFWFVVWQIVSRRVIPHLWALLLMGGLIGFTAMGIATILFLVPLLIAGLFLRWQATIPRRTVGAAIVLAGLLLGTSAAWMHNYFVARDPVFLSAHSGVNFWIGNNPIATGYPKFPPGLHAGQTAMLRDSITVAEKEAGRSLRRSEVSAFWAKKARAYIRDHFGDWLRLLGMKLANFWNAFQYDDLSVITTLREAEVISPGIRFGLLAALALPGLALAWTRYPLSRWVAGAVFLHMISLLSVFVTERYRLAAVPGLFLFASFGVWQLWSDSVRGNYRRALIYLCLLSVSTWFVSIPRREPSLWALDSYNSGLQALATNQLAKAERKLDLAYAYVPENAELNFALGNLRLAQGKKKEAKSLYFATLCLDPAHAGAYNNLGVLALQESRWNLAEKLFTRSLEQGLGDAKTYYLLARAHFGGGDIAGAKREIQHGLSLDPKRPELLKFLEQLEGP